MLLLGDTPLSLLSLSCPYVLMYAGDRTERDVPVDRGGGGETVGEVRADERL